MRASRPANAPTSTNITVDGTITDWTGIAPILTDPTGDATVAVPGADITKVFLAQDADNVYVRIDVASGSLGQGLAIGVGMALVLKRLAKSPARPPTISAAAALSSAIVRFGPSRPARISRIA